MNIKEYKKSLKLWMKNKLKNYVENFKKNNQTNISIKGWGIIIRSIHMSLPVFFILILLCYPFIFCNFVLLIIIIILFLFYSFDCCFLSVLEKYICEDNFVIFDPLLELFHIEINNENRYHISNLLVVQYIIMVAVIYYIRFLYK